MTQHGFPYNDGRTFKASSSNTHTQGQSEFTVLADDLGHGGVERLGTWTGGYDSPNLNEASSTLQGSLNRVDLKKSPHQLPSQDISTTLTCTNLHLNDARTMVHYLK